MAEFDFNNFFNQAASAVKGVAGSIADRAVQGYDLGKNEYDIQIAERDLSRYYKALGRIMYQIEKGQLKRDDTVVANACAQITECLAKIASLKEKTKEIKSRDVSFKMEKTAAKDPREEFNEELEKAEEELHKNASPDENATLLMKFCPECNAGNAPDATRCSSCGHEF